MSELGFLAEIAARTVWMEARNQGDAGMSAVAHVLRNRVADGRWGTSFATVCLAPFQFSCWNTADPNRGAMARLGTGDTSLEAARTALLNSANQADPTDGATHYVTEGVLEQMAPAWTKGATRTVQIGQHVFFKGVA